MFMTDPTQFDAVIIGGGAAVTEEFLPAFRNSTASYSVSLLKPKIVRAMDPARHGLELKLRP
jgi:phytoene dehydrogenase-like protein